MPDENVRRTRFGGAEHFVHTSADPRLPAPSLRRRQFLLSAAAAGLAAGGGLAPLSLRAAASSSTDFGRISAFVTGAERLDPGLVERAHAALTGANDGFDDRLAALAQAVEATGSDTIDDFLATGPSDALRATMTEITATWYLGYTGTPDPSQETDDATFVTYHEALMWGPTADATPIPTYSHHHQNYWAEPPASIAND